MAKGKKEATATPLLDQAAAVKAVVKANQEAGQSDRPVTLQTVGEVTRKKEGVEFTFTAPWSGACEKALASQDLNILTEYAPIEVILEAFAAKLSYSVPNSFSQVLARMSDKTTSAEEKRTILETLAADNAAVQSLVDAYNVKSVAYEPLGAKADTGKRAQQAIDTAYKAAKTSYDQLISFKVAKDKAAEAAKEMFEQTLSLTGDKRAEALKAYDASRITG